MIRSLACCAPQAAAVAHNCATNIDAAQATPSRLSYSQNPRRPALPAPRPARDQHHVPGLLFTRLARQAHPPLRALPPPGQHAPARRAGQLPVSQLPFDHVPVSVYREHDASARQPSGPPVSGCQTKRRNGRAAPITDVITVPSHTKKDNPKAALKPRPRRQRRDRVPTSSFPATVDNCHPALLQVPDAPDGHGDRLVVDPGQQVVQRGVMLPGSPVPDPDAVSGPSPHRLAT